MGMTSRERVARLLRHELPDRMGLYEHFWPETLSHYWPKQGYAEGTLAENYFDYDLRGTSWIDWTPIRGVEEIVEETDEWKLAKQGNGAILRYWKNKSGTPEHVDFDCITPQRWEEKYKPPLLKLDPDRIDIGAVREALEDAKSKHKFSFYGGLGVFELLRATLGDVVMLESFVLEPEWIRDFCETYTQLFLKHIEYLFNHAGQPDGAFIYEDLGYNKGLFCSPAMYREIIMPYHKRLFDFFHEHGMPVILHSCGNVTEAVPHIIEAGVDCLQPMEAKAGVDVVSLAEKYGDRLSFMGNIDVRVLERGDREEIEQEIGAKMDALKNLGAAYFFHSDHSISPQVSFKAYKFALEVYKAHAGY